MPVLSVGSNVLVVVGIVRLILTASFVHSFVQTFVYLYMFKYVNQSAFAISMIFVRSRCSAQVIN